MSRGQWLLYGATGYTGQLIAEEAVRRGMRPVLAGRHPGRVAALAATLGLEHVVFDLMGPAYVEKIVRNYDAVLHCAGPFFETYRAMVDGCIAAGTHYLDITGEIAVFEACARRDERARNAGVVLLPGVGFDVVPSDCLAASLHATLPTATHLELAFGGGAGFSRGTAKTMVSGFGLGGAIRRGGKIVRVPLAWRARTIHFRDKARYAVTIPWGDVSTAFHSTGIPDIEVYTAMPPKTVQLMRLGRWISPLLALGPVRALAIKRVDATVTGPSAERRDATRMQLWGRVSDAAGHFHEATLVTPEGYSLTAIAAVEAVHRLLGGGVAAGFRTPSLAFGADFVTQLPGCDLQWGSSAP
ncbi:MAG: saccharopine dehydrogenase NADP-binding domain-containing protein [Gemmatimonadaceae bacterium]|nr:saccharopine dehydrogenase NADP-binding domain-containing protein [Gemmatimonadaceae bacterium]